MRRSLLTGTLIAAVAIGAACSNGQPVAPTKALFTSAPTTTSLRVSFTNTPLPSATLTDTPTPTPTPTPIPTPSPTLSPTPSLLTLTFTDGFDVKKALEILYKQENLVFTQDGQAEIAKEILGNIYTGTIDIVLVAPFSERKIPKYVLLVGKSFRDINNCHSCSADIEGGIFIQAGNGWELETSNHSLGELGSFGVAPKGQLAHIGSDKLGFLFFDTFSGGGGAETRVVLYAEIAGKLSEILNVHIATEFYPLDPNYVPPLPNYASRLKFIRGTNSVYDDIELHTADLEQVNGVETIVENVKILVFDGSQYKLQK